MIELSEMLVGYDWVSDPTTGLRARVAYPGTENDNAIILVEANGESVSCWLWCNKTGEQLGNTILHAETPEELDEAFQELHRLWEQAGECPICGMRMGIFDHKIACSCGHAVTLRMEVMA